ncbi:MAG: hypothetical protein WKG06_47120 [Segetibacter sp.]
MKKHSSAFHPVVPFDSKKDKLLHLDFTAANTDLTNEILLDTNAFSDYMLKLLDKNINMASAVMMNIVLFMQEALFLTPVKNHAGFISALISGALQAHLCLHL